MKLSNWKEGADFLMRKMLILWMALLLTFASACAESGGDMVSHELTVDFSVRAGVPLMKKYGLFNSGLVTLKQYDSYMHLMDDLRVDSLRIDLFAGSRGQPMGEMVTGTAENLQYDFSALDTILASLSEHGSRLYASWCYIPLPLQKNGNWRSGPTDMKAWQEIYRQYAAYYAEKGVRIPYHEIYNEPDCGNVFFTGSFADYTEMYVAAARGLKEGNSDAVIGGPSSAFVENSAGVIPAFLRTVIRENVPMDFFSYHSYGCDAKQYIARTRQARALVSAHPELDTTELHLNEFNSLIQPFELNGPAEHVRGGSTLLTAFELLLDETDVTLAHWAQFLDTGIEPLGAVDVRGRQKAAYWAYWMYSHMPEQRVSISGLGENTREGLHAMASADESQAAILVWNDHPKDTVDVAITLSELPIRQGELRLYHMEEATDSYWIKNADTTLIPEISDLASLEDELHLTLGPGGFALYLFDSGKEQVVHDTPGELVRKRYYFPERGKSNFAFYDETDPTVYLGMNGELIGRSVVAMEFDGLPDMLALQSKLSGIYETLDLHSSFSVRVDYEVNGAYPKACIFSFMPMNVRRDNALPWGTERQADEIVIEKTLLTGKTLLTLANHAPEGWSGSAILTFDLQNAGPTCQTEITMIGLR